MTGPHTMPLQRSLPGRSEIVVGTDGSVAAAAALQYALGLAAASGAAVRVIHVVPTHVPVPAGLAGPVRDAGEVLLADAERRARLAAPEVEVRSALLEGPRGTRLAEAARSADLVVLGRSGRPHHLVAGSVAAALIEHTAVPVRIVPPDWSRRATRSEVVVGVKDAARSRALLERGFQVARELGEPLVLLHAWGLPGGYEEVMALADSDAWNAELTERVRTVARSIRGQYRDVPYQVRVVHGRTVQALEVASRRACFLLLGRSTHHRSGGPRAGVGHVLANLAECPVEIGPEPRATAPVIDLELEARGRLLR